MADQGASEGNKCFVDVVASLEAKLEPAVLVDPAKSAFHDVSVDAKTAAMLGTATGDLRRNVPIPKQLAMRVRIIATISQQIIRTKSRVPAHATYRWHAVYQGN